MEESQSAYLSRTPEHSRSSLTKDEARAVVRNKDTSSPSLSVSQETSVSRISVSQETIPSSRSNLPNISDIEEEESSFNISDLANYTDRGELERRKERNTPSQGQSRSP